MSKDFRNLQSKFNPMKIKKEDALKMDLVLSYLLKNEQARVKSKQVQDLLKISFDDAHHIYESILKYHLDVEPVVSVLNAENIASAPGITDLFLKKGGFIAISEQKENQENKIRVNKMKEIKESKWIIWQRKTYWFTFVLAVSAFILALISFLVSLGIVK